MNADKRGYEERPPRLFLNVANAGCNAESMERRNDARRNKITFWLYAEIISESRIKRPHNLKELTKTLIL